MLTRRVGQFAIAMVIIEQDPEAVFKIFQDVIVLQATPMGEIIKYMGMSNHFRELIVDTTVPEYICECTKDKEGNISLKWVEKTTKLVRGVG